MIHATTHTRGKRNEHHATILAHTLVITPVTRETVFSCKKKSHKRHCTKLEDSDLGHWVSAKTTTDDQVRIVCQDRRGGHGKYTATFHMFSS